MRTKTSSGTGVVAGVVSIPPARSRRVRTETPPLATPTLIPHPRPVSEPVEADLLASLAGPPAFAISAPRRAETETRTPGSEFILPANPLSALTDNQLEGFVECTLYEETSTFRADSVVDIPDVAPNARPRLVATGEDAWPFRSVTGLPFLGDEPSEPAPPAYPTSPASVMAAVHPTGALAAEYPTSAVIYVPPETPGYGVVEPAYAPTEPAYAQAAVALPPVPAPRRQIAPWIVIAASAVIALVLAVGAVALLVRSSSPESRPPVEATAKPPAPAGSAAAPAIATDPEEPDAAGEESPDDPSGAIVGSGPCRMTITTTPAGSTVKIDGEGAGVSPVTVDGPCERRRIDVARPRYAPVTRHVTPVLDKPETIEVALVRPTHALTVVTTPPGATISIEGKRAGTTPAVVQITGFNRVKITLEKPGYRSVTQRFYSTAAEDRLAVRLGAK